MKSAMRARATASTWVAALQQQVELRATATALRYRRAGAWQDSSWLEWHANARALGALLVARGIEPGDRVGLVANNGLQWVVADLAIQSIGAVSVPIYASSTADQTAFILGDCEAKLVFCEDAARVQELVQRTAELPALRHLLCLHRAADSLWPPSMQQGFRRGEQDQEPHFIPSWEQLLALGRAAEQSCSNELAARAAALSSEQLATLVYTSGTTGAPKGVQLTHGNLLAGAEASREHFRASSDDTLLLVLPLTHLFARTSLLVAVLAGAVAAIDADLRSLEEHCQAVRPSVLPLVPRVFERLAAQQRTAVAPALRSVLGGRTRLLTSGGAALQPAVARLFAEQGLPIIEVYGLTECGAAATAVPPGELRIGSVGRSVGAMQVRVAPDGEVLLSGPSVMRGYFRRPEEDALVFSCIEGKRWLHTGDIGHLDSEGYLWITDRKKDLFKTSGAKYIAPQQLENLIKAQSTLVSQVAICGDGRQFVSALITLDECALARFASERDCRASRAELLRGPELLARLQADIDAVNARLAPFETIKRFRVLPAEFTLEAGELTPTVKLRRRVIHEKYRQLIDEMYAE
jgi:long-chain acyl-CoA synthetase